ncbi:transcriptional regulator [Marinobacterium nitratireducens]|uniref:Transcriptional regulator n=1 Tax=Marinobacterium nitratireducens TaxID=518897 RepID=A0A918DTL0_9GAMM|nr:LysR substrate-binding domain-containing protein [Marinobacterium nitratireducens]GGO83382.1 transcriptional regulator [Marinobacterium nitratireducens]
MDIAQKVMSRIKLRQLQLIVAIDDTKTLRGASDSIGMSQPAATQSLRELEAALDCKLFERTNRGVVPTTYGASLVRHARSILTQVRHAGEELSDLASGAGGRIVVGTLLAAAAIVLPRAIERMREVRPNLIIKVIEGTNDILMPRLLRGDIDLVIGRLPEYEYRQGTEQLHLYDEDIIVFASPGNPLTAHARVTLEELSRCDWVLPPIETTLRAQLEKAFFDAELEPPRCVIESTSWLTNSYLWRNTELIGVAPAHTVESRIARGDLIRLPVDLNQRLGPVGISVPKGNEPSTVVKSFIRELQLVSREL